MSERLCSGCQAELDPDAMFCNECGSVQAVNVIASDRPENLVAAVRTTDRTCPQCKKQVEGEVRFCPGCAFDFATSEVIAAGEMACPNCQRAYNSDDRFCRSCAFDLSTISGASNASSAQFCTGCGKPFEPTDRFCRHCAADISKSAHTVAVPIINSAVLSQSKITVPANLSTPFVAPQSQTGTASGELVGESPKGPHWISPSAAAFVVICFFLPWIEWSCFGSSVPVSGVQIANRDTSFLLFPVAAITTIIVYFVFKAQKSLWKARPWILISSGLALLLLFYKVASIPSAEVFGTRITASDLGFKPQIGSIGTVIGLIASMLGCIFMGRTSSFTLPAYATSNLGPNAGWFNPDSPHLRQSMPTLIDKVRALQPNKAAMLCYLVPAVMPFTVQLLNALIGAVVGPLSVLLLLIVLASYFVAQTVLLRTSPHDRTAFVRFHAFQSVFQILAGWAIMAVLFGWYVLWATLPPNGAEAVPGGLIFVVAIANTVLSVVMCVKANRGEMFKLPLIGDWAFSLSKGNNGNVDVTGTPR